MNEPRTITVSAYRSPDGRPTCCSSWPDHACGWMGVRKFGTVEVCRPLSRDIDRDGADGTGYLRPVDGCPVWAGEIK